MRNEKGFSLIELMIVVAIIGILAAIAVPNFQKYQAKSRQAEAKSLLTGIFTANKAFAAEWTAFSGDFGHIGFAPEGDLRYNAGFAGVGYAPAANYTGPAGTGESDTNTHCGASPNCVALDTLGLPGAATTPSSTAFVAAAAGNIDGDASEDHWQIDQAKALRISGGQNDLDD